MIKYLSPNLAHLPIIHAVVWSVGWIWRVNFWFADVSRVPATRQAIILFALLRCRHRPAALRANLSSFFLLMRSQGLVCYCWLTNTRVFEIWWWWWWRLKSWFDDTFLIQLDVIFLDFIWFSQFPSFQRALKQILWKQKALVLQPLAGIFFLHVRICWQFLKHWMSSFASCSPA